MQNSIKLPFAWRGHQLVHINDVESGLQPDCLCPECKSPLVAKKGDVISHHFAHHREGGCSRETVLHKTGKLLLYDHLCRAKQHGGTTLEWDCNECGLAHETMILGNNETIHLEQNLGEVRPGEVRPDLLIRDQQGMPIFVIEIVVTHPPSPAALDYYRRHNIFVVRFVLHSMEHLYPLMSKNQLYASSVNLCHTPPCTQCQCRRCRCTEIERERRFYARTEPSFGTIVRNPSGNYEMRISPTQSVLCFRKRDTGGWSYRVSQGPRQQWSHLQWSSPTEVFAFLREFAGRS